MTEHFNRYPFARGQFACKGCATLFFADREAVDYDDEVATATCPACGEDSIETVYMKNLHKTLGSAKGANMSPEGRAKNRLNGFTTGSSMLRPWYDSKIPMPPAKPGKYPECEDCQDLDECHSAVIVKYGTCIPVYCHRRTDVTLKYVSAFLANDHEKLRLLAAENAAQMQMVFNASIKKIFDRGVEVIESHYERNKAGDILKDDDGHTIKGEKIYAHPLIKRCIEIMQAMGFTLPDWTMTPKSKEAKEQVSGFLAGVAAGSGTTIEAMGEKFSSEIERFRGAIEKANELRSRDKTLQTFETESGKREGGE